MKLVATPEDIKWFQGIVSNPEYHKECVDKLHNTTYMDIDVSKVRSEFVDRFYPYINDRKKKEKLSFIDSIMNL